VIDEEGNECPGTEYQDPGPVIIALLVASIGALFLWSDFRGDTPGRVDGMIASEVVARAGATVTPSEKSFHLISRQTTLDAEPSTIDRAIAQIIGHVSFLGRLWLCVVR
jgi:hypothetical protein